MQQRLLLSFGQRHHLRVLLPRLALLACALCPSAAAAPRAQVELVGEVRIANGSGGFEGMLGNDKFGSSIACIGDLDNDGNEDFAVGAPAGNAVWILFMEGDGTVKTEQVIDGIALGFENQAFGYAIAGYPGGAGPWTLAVGAYNSDIGGENRGAVVLLKLDTAGLVLDPPLTISSNEVSGILDNDTFGISVEWIGDIDGNGVADLAVGADQSDFGGDSRGSVWILQLGLDGSVLVSNQIVDGDGGLALADRSRFGSSLAAMQLDADPLVELAVGASMSAGGEVGSIWILQLDGAGEAVSSQHILSPEPGEGDLFGGSLEFLGDLDQDGNFELAVGAQLDSEFAGTHSGAFWILSLDSTGAQVGSPQKIPSELPGFVGPVVGGDNFGSGVALLGDTDGIGPGIFTIAVGAIVSQGTGAVWLLSSSAGGCAQTGLDCNNNGQDDGCDIATGQSLDCNANGIPDECEPDCDSDGVPDDCEADCDANGTPDDCEPFVDCNSNGVPDPCDLSSGQSLDCNTNDIPDECEPDCNNNGIPDDCDIASGQSLDCNADGIPDECEPDCNQNGVPDSCDQANGTPLIEVTGFASGSAMSAPTTGGGTVVFEGQFLYADTVVTFESSSFSALGTDVVSMAGGTQLSVTAPIFPPGPNAASQPSFDVEVRFVRAGCAQTSLSAGGGPPFSYSVVTIYVDDDAPDGGDGSWETPFDTVQEGIDAALPGNAIQVLPGSYDQSDQSLVIQGAALHAITLTSSDVTQPAQTRLKGGELGNSLHPALIIDAAGADVVVTGLEIYLGNVGLLLRNGASPWILRNRIEKNFATLSGAGIRLEDSSSARIEQNVFSFNRTSLSGGCVGLVDSASAQVIGNSFLANISYADGGAISADTDGSLVLRDNWMQQNIANGSGGGMDLDVRGGLTLTDNVLVENTAGADGGGIRWRDTSLQPAPLELFGHLLIDNEAAGSGGGLYLGNAAGESMLASILASEVSDNSAGADGGGIYMAPSLVAQLHLNRIAGNTSETGSGAGIFCAGSERSSIRNNRIDGNACEHCEALGGGILVDQNGSATIEHNIIQENSAQKGGAIACLVKSSSTIERNVIAFNRSIQAPECDGSEPPPFFAPGILALDESEYPGAFPDIMGNTIHANTVSVGAEETGGIHGVRVGFGTPDWIDNLLTGDEDWGVYCSINTGVRIDYNGFRNNSFGALNPNSAVLGGPAFENNQEYQASDPLYLAPAQGDFTLDLLSPARSTGEGMFAGAVRPDGEVSSSALCVVDEASSAEVSFPDDFVFSLTEVYLQIVHLAAADMPSVPISMAAELRFLPDSGPTRETITLALPLRRDVPIGTSVYLHRWDDSQSNPASFVVTGQVALAPCSGELMAVFPLPAGSTTGTFLGLSEPFNLGTKLIEHATPPQAFGG